jgi:hypothetical protein
MQHEDQDEKYWSQGEETVEKHEISMRELSGMNSADQWKARRARSPDATIVVRSFRMSINYPREYVAQKGDGARIDPVE